MVISEADTIANSFASPNRFNYLNNYEQFENNVDFNEEILRNVPPSNKPITS